jgi:PAS domain-containing protein
MDYSQNLPLILVFLTILLLLIVAGIYYDIKLKKSEELWKFALEGAGDGVWDWDVKNDIAHFSNRYKEMFGFSDDDINASIREWHGNPPRKRLHL